MDPIRLSCALPCCRNPADEQTKLSEAVRVIAVVLGILGMVAGALILRHPNFNHIPSAFGWSSLAIGIIMSGLGLSFRCVKDTRVQEDKMAIQQDSCKDQWKEGIEKGEIQTIKTALENQTLKDNLTSYLRFAALHGQDELVKLFLEHGANPKSTKREVSALYSAIGCKNEEKALKTIAVLLEHDYTLVSESMEGWGKITPLHRAIDWQSTGCMELLIKKGADVNAQNSDKNTPLHFTALDTCEPKINVVKILLEGKADPHLKNSEGKTFIQLVQEKHPGWLEKQEVIDQLGSYISLKEEKVQSKVFSQ